MIKLKGSKKFRGWVEVTYVKDGVFTRTQEFKEWDSFSNLVENLQIENMVKFYVGIDKSDN